MSRERGRSRSWRNGATFALIAGGVFLAWECIKVPLAERAPPAVAVSVAPTSPEVLRRAAEVELAARRAPNALSLSEDSLTRAPFNARALRVRGLAEAEVGSVDSADQILTLAGNWSLRDDAAHGWLVQHRLRRGDYASAFAHADTLARRREELLQPTMNLFSTAGAADTRAASALTSLLATNPPWRAAYLGYLQGRPDGDALLATLAIALQTTRAPLSLEELKGVYGGWAGEGRYPAVAAVRRRLDRPPASEWVLNSDFAEAAEQQITPFGWTLGSGSGVSAIITDDDEGNGALRVEYDGYGGTTMARQLVVLTPGAWTLSGRLRMDTPGDPRIRWIVSCVTGQVLATLPLRPQPPGQAWARFEASFETPGANCPAQYLTLSPYPGDRRTTIVAWLDDVRVAAAS